MQIKLGEKVRDKITGFVGIATAKTEFLNGCIQYDVIPKADKNNKILESVAVDEQSLEVITPKKKKVIKKVKERNGGAMRIPFKQRGY
ncbi:hypothetical protein LCGC14_0509660 [marine sediment metagenome]|uniref:Uncharacterized protein n=1 Tax=marine sediment metagenome TaxID=412755 RepID=A0A0F9S1S5_9ZZZZ|nr:hypothetical protein [bacterium]